MFGKKEKTLCCSHDGIRVHVCTGYTISSSIHYLERGVDVGLVCFIIPFHPDQSDQVGFKLSHLTRMCYISVIHGESLCNSIAEISPFVI